MKAVDKPTNEQLKRFVGRYGATIKYSFKLLQLAVDRLRSSDGKHPNVAIGKLVKTIEKLDGISDANLNKLSEFSNPDSSDGEEKKSKSAITKIKEGFKKTFVNIYKTFGAIAGVAKNCFIQKEDAAPSGSNSLSFLANAAGAIAENVMLAVPGANFIALAWRIARTVYYIGKAVYNFVEAVKDAIEHPEKLIGMALGYAIKGVVYLTTGVSLKKRRAYNRMFKRTYRKNLKRRHNRYH